MHIAGRSWHSKSIQPAAAKFLEDHQLLYTASRYAREHLSLPRHIILYATMPLYAGEAAHQRDNDHSTVLGQNSSQYLTLLCLHLCLPHLLLTHATPHAFPASDSVMHRHTNMTHAAACRNKDGRLWASVLAGPLGFLQARNPTQLVATPMSRIPGDPAELNMGDHIGTLAIKLETRQRERVNGVVSANKGSVLGIEVQQSFSGCPKYIQARAIKVDDAKLQKGRHSADARVSEGDEELLDEQRDFVER